MKPIKIKYFSKDYEKLERIEGNKSDWIDLRVDRLIKRNDKLECCQCYEHINKPIKYEKGDVLFFGLGVAMELPDGYEAHIAPRSSMFKNTGFILTNGIGI